MSETHSALSGSHRPVWLCLGLALALGALAGCVVIEERPDESVAPDAGDDATNSGPCAVGALRCDGVTVYKCVEGQWYADYSCDQLGGYICQTGVCVCAKAGCKDRECGDDGCGGSCGACPHDFVCSPDHQCVDCVPDCAGRQCGDDGCGGSCGECPVGPCNQGTCPCAPNCDGRECGPDGCGGSCGGCPPEESCDKGQCVDRVSCQGLLQCYSGCLQQRIPPSDCAEDCIQLGTTNAVGRFLVYTDCLSTAQCDTLICVAEECSAEYAGCVYEDSAGLSCPEIIDCVAACPDNDPACLEGCENEGSAQGQIDYAGMSLCLAGACPSGSSAGCATDSVSPGGACNSFAIPCELAP